MMGFVVNKTFEPKSEKIKYKKETIDAWVINFEVEELKNPNSQLRPITNVKIWIRKGIGDVTQSEIYKLYQDITMKRSVTKFFESNVEKNSDMLPVIYQPYIDAWKNFLREIHVHPLTDRDFEVTLIFNDEILRAHAPLDVIYRVIRVIIHKRIKDVETFCVHLDERDDLDNNNFRFPGIYSDENTLFADNIHGNDPADTNVKQDVSIEYYFQSDNHPIVFINTSNHAMAERDTNHDFWKWEYTPWTEGIPIKIKDQSRETIDDSFRIIKRKFWRKVFGIKESTNTKCNAPIGI